MSEDNLVYLLENKVYINLTNKCTNDCLFCIRNLKNDVAGFNMFLHEEKISAEDVIHQLEKFEKYFNNGIVFCGYGEPTIKIDILKEIAKYVKENYPNVKIRLNTNGQGNLINKRNIVDEIKGLIDEISISLNADTEDLYNKLSQPKLKGAYSAMLEFANLTKKAGIKTTLSVVSGYKDVNINIKNCEKIATDIGADFRNREWIENGY